MVESMAQGLPPHHALREFLPMANSTPSSPVPPPAVVPVSVRYLGNIAHLSGAFHQARVRFPGNPPGALHWMARQLGHALPQPEIQSIAAFILDTRGGWRPVDDRPGITPTEEGRSAQRLADRGILVIALHTDRAGTPDRIALVAPGGVALVSGKSPNRSSPRFEDFRIVEAGSKKSLPTRGWRYRQAPAWTSVGS